MFLPKSLQNKLTTHAKNALLRAAKSAASSGPADGVAGGVVEIPHILYGIACVKGSIGHNVLKSYKIGADDIRKLFLSGASAGQLNESEAASADFSSQSKKVMQKAMALAAKFESRFVGTEHILYAVVLSPKTPAASLFAKPREVKNRLEEIIASASQFPDFLKVLGGKNLPEALAKATGFGGTNLIPVPVIKNRPARHGKSGVVDGPGNEEAKTSKKKKRPSALEYFCKNLSGETEDGLFDPVIGREKEISRLIHILSRRLKNNPVLVGEAGVGKTAVVQGLADRMAKGQVPENLLGKKIYLLDLGSLVAGTVFRGEFEARIKDVLEEAEDPNIILFIDEIHNLVGAGNPAGSLDAANVLKPGLAQGALRLIGATTPKEYRRYIEQDPALERRFQKIIVGEPSGEETVKILKGLKKHYEDHHKIKIKDEALYESVRLAERYLPERRLPDKALDLLDETASFLRAQTPGNKFSPSRRIYEIEKQIKNLKDDEYRALDEERYEDIVRHREKINRLSSAAADVRKNSPLSPGVKIMGADAVRETLARITGIPVHNLGTEETGGLRNLEERLSSRVLGQKEAVRALSSAIRRSRAGLGRHNSPVGSFLFLGPTGVGKTELAKTLAEVLGQNQNIKTSQETFRPPLIRVDMSEFAEPHSISKLVGSPPGYIGYEDEGQLSKALRANPYAVILFDELEKAHPVVHNALLQVLDEGGIRDSSGRFINFRNAVIIMTSNIGTAEFTKAAIGFGARRREISRFQDLNIKTSKSESSSDAELETFKFLNIKISVLDRLRERVSPELISRLDNIIVFRPLDGKTVSQIVRLHLKSLKARITNYRLRFTKKAEGWLAQKSFSPADGARLVRKIIEREVEEKLADLIIEGKIKKGETITIDADKKGIIIK